ncbi:hypothetical protein HHK36_003176 [Tetracentron sinense]|uniref:HMG box domain-containing protein n=1 Tax=Tetracentron sinense TaxID=13715 RepID=A0A835DRV3_TETSI|nr:hypothetical protein HHK36_003176 [Tetracentron sinense]
MKAAKSKTDAKKTDSKFSKFLEYLTFFHFHFPERREEFRKQFKEKNPNNKSVAVVGKAGGDKWKSLSDAEKAPFVAKAEKRKSEYAKNLQAYNKKQEEDDD